MTRASRATPTPSCCCRELRARRGPSGRPELLDEAARVLEERFLTPAGLYADAWDRSWTELDPYRGVNANMHAVEACLAAADATGDGTFLDRALTITTRVVDDWAGRGTGACPSTSTPTGPRCPSTTATSPTTRSSPSAPPSGTASSGRGSSSSSTPPRRRRSGRPDWMVPAAPGPVRPCRDRRVGRRRARRLRLHHRLGRHPVVRDRMHWVLAEGICAAAALHDATGDPAYDEHYRTWWDHAATHWVDPTTGRGSTSSPRTCSRPTRCGPDAPTPTTPCTPSCCPGCPGAGSGPRGRGGPARRDRLSRRPAPTGEPRAAVPGRDRSRREPSGGRPVRSTRPPAGVRFASVPVCRDPSSTGADACRSCR